MDERVAPVGRKVGRARGRGREALDRERAAAQAGAGGNLGAAPGGDEPQAGAGGGDAPPAEPSTSTGVTIKLEEVRIDDGKGDGFTEEEQKKRWEEFMRQRDYMVTRPEYLESKKGGKEGLNDVNVSLIGNFFRVELRQMQDWRYNQYRVDFEPDQDSTRIRKGLMRQVQDKIPGYIYDGGHMLFTTKTMQVDPMILNSVFKTKEGDELHHVIKLKHVKGVPWNDPQVIQFYNILMRQSMEKLNLIFMGRHYFNPDLQHKLPSHRLSIWPGYKTVMRPYEQQLLINVEMVSKIVREDTMLVLMQEVRQDALRTGKDFKTAINEKFSGVIVMTEFNKKTYRVNGFDWEKKVSDTFDTRNGPITFMDYYQNKYGRKITSMNQPLMISSPKAKDFHRGDTQDVLLVPELCVLTGLTEDMRSNFGLMRDLKSFMIVEPAKRAEQIETFMQRLVECGPLKEELASKWGVRYPSNKMIDVPGRVIPPERIVFGNGQDFIDDSKPADWTNAFRSRKLFATVPMKRWAVLAPSRENACVDNLIKTLQKVSTPLGYMIANPITKIVNGMNARAYEAAIDEVMAQAQGKIDMIFIILPSPQAQLYAVIKQKAALQYGVLSQCCLSKNAVKANMSVFTKIAVQMCAKQGGEPWSVNNPLAKANLMVVGFDVYHSGGPSEKKTSIGALVATTNGALSRYTSMVMMAQKYEISASMGSDFSKLLDKYKQINGRLPARIIFYRDGVGEGQLSQVQEVEVSGIEENIKFKYEEDAAELPKFSFIVVSKRINARFMLQKKVNNQIVRENPAPGTVIDDVVTLPERYDFYLMSQLARQGTVSPTSYNVIRDHPSLTPRQIQVFSYKLCHLYYNWSGTVSVPAVCQYAHKLAYLTGLSLNKPVHTNLSNLLHFL